jgi:lipoprotein-anchoring transpeptidase ErfK/SrfK
MYERIMAGIALGTIAVTGILALDAQDHTSGAVVLPAAPNTTTSTTSRTVVDTTVLAMQRRLADLGYDVGPIDGKLGARTRYAQTAFEKIGGRPRPIVPTGATTRVEIDLRRQVLLYWKQGALALVLPVSTGSGKTYCVAGKCERAITPIGTFRIERKVPGVDDGPLGTLYSPMYFHNGVAIHGYPSVPTSPASHGCVRIPMYATAGLFQQLAVGTPVYVVAG